MINDYSLAHPLIILLTKSYTNIKLSLNKRSYIMSKHVIILGIFALLLTILSFILTQYLVLNLISIGLFVFYLVIFFTYSKLGRYKLAEIYIKIEEIYDGDKFKIQLVNEEIVINILSELFKVEGMFIMTEKIIESLILISWVSYIIYSIVLIISFFI